MSDPVKAALNKLQSQITQLAVALDQRDAIVRGVPRVAAEIEMALIELASAEADCNTHFARFPNEQTGDFEEHSEECRADWHRCCRRRDEAVTRLTNIGRALQMRNALPEEAPAVAS